MLSLYSEKKKLTKYSVKRLPQTQSASHQLTFATVLQNCWVVFTQGMEVYFIGNSDLPFLRLSLLSICGPHVSKVEEYIYKLNVQSVIEVQAATGYLGVLYLGMIVIWLETHKHLFQ